MATETPSLIGLCECGCGETTKIATSGSRGVKAGEHRRFMAGHQSRKAVVKTYRWRTPARHGSCELAHRVIVERVLGKPLPVGAEVHHVDGNKSNNTHRNLVVCQDHAYHLLLHVRTNILKSDGDPDSSRRCFGCGSVKPFAEFPPSWHQKSVGVNRQCRTCRQQAHIQRTFTRSFSVGERVQWTTHGQRTVVQKTGTITAIVKAGELPDQAQFTRICLRANIGLPRLHQSYVVVSGDVPYWPRVGSLVRLGAETYGDL